MTRLALHSTPRSGRVLVSQIRATGLCLLRPALVAAALAALATVLIAIDVLRTGESIAFHPEHQMFPGVVGLLFPLFVWKDHDRFGTGFLWSLPVDRRRHALARVMAGWLWLMTGLVAFTLWLLGVCLLSGGSILAAETLRVLPSSAFTHQALSPENLRSVLWSPNPLLWLVPFTAATGTYLLASALALAVRHPLRWVAGAVLAVFLVAAVGHAAAAGWLIRLPEKQLGSLLNGTYGLDALLTARTESLKIDTTLTTGETVVVWRDLPTLGQWLTATLIWTTAGMLCLWAASARHGERRRP
jgi:hypothetical protein